MAPITSNAKGKEPIKAPAKVLRPAMRNFLVPSGSTEYHKGWLLPLDKQTQHLYSLLFSTSIPPACRVLLLFPWGARSPLPLLYCFCVPIAPLLLYIYLLLSPHMSILSKHIWRRKSYIYPGHASSYTNVQNLFYFFASPLSITRRVSFIQSLDFAAFYSYFQIRRRERNQRRP